MFPLCPRGAQDAAAEDHLGNVLSMLAWSTGKELAELRKVPERDVWLMHPAIVNAWYSPNHNTISKNHNIIFENHNIISKILILHILFSPNHNIISKNHNTIS